MWSGASSSKDEADVVKQQMQQRLNAHLDPTKPWRPDRRKLGWGYRKVAGNPIGYVNFRAVRWRPGFTADDEHRLIDEFEELTAVMEPGGPPPQSPKSTAPISTHDITPKPMLLQREEVSIERCNAEASQLVAAISSTTQRCFAEQSVAQQARNNCDVLKSELKEAEDRYDTVAFEVVAARTEMMTAASTTEAIEGETRRLREELRRRTEELAGESDVSL